MRLTRLAVLLAGTVAIAACGTTEGTGPVTLAESEVIDIMPDYAASGAAIIDRAGIGGAEFPDSIALTTEQKAAIQALHDGFKTSTTTDLTALQAIEDEAKAARAAGKTREEIRAILQRAIPIRDRLDDAFRTLRAAILAIYTPAQRAWIEAQKTRECRNGDAPQLSEAQLAQIKSLRHAFENANRADIMLLKQVADEVKAAREAGKTDAEIRAILVKADAARARVRAAEQKLFDDIMAVLTAEQRAAWCVGRGMRGGGGVVGNG